jgi:hypothetical protein
MASSGRFSARATDVPSNSERDLGPIQSDPFVEGGRHGEQLGSRRAPRASRTDNLVRTLPYRDAARLAAPLADLRPLRPRTRSASSRGDPTVNPPWRRATLKGDWAGSTLPVR